MVTLQGSLGGHYNSHLADDEFEVQMDWFSSFQCIDLDPYKNQDSFFFLLEGKECIKGHLGVHEVAEDPALMAGSQNITGVTLRNHSSEDEGMIITSGYHLSCLWHWQETMLLEGWSMLLWGAESLQHHPSRKRFCACTGLNVHFSPQPPHSPQTSVWWNTTLRWWH